MKSTYTFGERDNLTELLPGTVVLLQNIIAGQVLEGHLGVTGTGQAIPLDKVPPESFPLVVVHVPPNDWQSRWGELVKVGEKRLEELLKEGVNGREYQGNSAEGS